MPAAVQIAMRQGFNGRKGKAATAKLEGAPVGHAGQAEFSRASSYFAPAVYERIAKMLTGE